MFRFLQKLTPTQAALTGFSSVIPFVILNSIVGAQIEPFFSLLRPDIHTSSQEYFLLFIVVVLVLVGALVSAYPMLKKDHHKRTYYPLNIVVSLILLVIFLILTSALGSEIYQCDILRIPNCD